MPVPEWLSKRFGGNVPDYIVRFYERRDAAKAERERKEKARQAKLYLERARIKALRRPPARVWRIGQTLFWEPPETEGQLKPAGYWVSEQRNGHWTNHGDYVLPDVFESQLFGTGPARVEAYYNDTALGEAYHSPAVEIAEGEHRFLVGAVKWYVTEKTRQGRAVGVERWRRVLAAFGVGEKYYDLRRGTVRNGQLPLDPAMSADEAQGYADLGWSRWKPVALALRRLENERNQN